MSSSEEKIWENPDPRVKWALDILDDGAYERTPIFGYFWYPGLFAALGGGGNLMRNWMVKRPQHAAVHITVFGATLGWLGGVWWRNRISQKNANDVATIKHYLMLHPEKFPEPEKKKFGDKEVFLEWPINR
jgi:hypothetical protein